MYMFKTKRFFFISTFFFFFLLIIIHIGGFKFSIQQAYAACGCYIKGNVFHDGNNNGSFDNGVNGGQGTPDSNFNANWSVHLTGNGQNQTINTSGNDDWTFDLLP